MIVGTGLASQQEFKRYTVTYGDRHFTVYSNNESFENHFDGIHRWIKQLADNRQWVNYQVSICDTTAEEATQSACNLFESCNSSNRNTAQE